MSVMPISMRKTVARRAAALAVLAALALAVWTMHDGVLAALDHAAEALDHAAEALDHAEKALAGELAAPLAAEVGRAASGEAQRAAIAARGAGLRVRAGKTRLLDARLNEEGPVAEALAAGVALRDATVALRSAAEALVEAARTLHDNGAIGPAGRTQVAASRAVDAALAAIDAADTVTARVHRPDESAQE